MCQQYVRGPCWGVGSLYGSAIEAWNGSTQKHPGDRNPPDGAPCYYSGGSYGHAVLFTDKSDAMRSTDCQSTGRVSETDLGWPERAWGYKYLGWTGDINGVDLPLSSSSNSETGEDDMPKYDHASRASDVTIAANEWRTISWDNVTGDGGFDVGQSGCEIGGRTYNAVLHATFDAPEGSTIRLRTIEWADGETREENPQTEMLATGGSSYATHALAGHVADGRVLRFSVTCSQDATLLSADAVVLSW
jgi:hypothetical protein